LDAAQLQLLLLHGAHANCRQPWHVHAAHAHALLLLLLLLLLLHDHELLLLLLHCHTLLLLLHCHELLLLHCHGLLLLHCHGLLLHRHRMLLHCHGLLLLHGHRRRLHRHGLLLHCHGLLLLHGHGLLLLHGHGLLLLHGHGRLHGALAPVGALLWAAARLPAFWWRCDRHEQVVEQLASSLLLLLLLHGWRAWRPSTWRPSRRKGARVLLHRLLLCTARQAVGHGDPASAGWLLGRRARLALKPWCRGWGGRGWVQPRLRRCGRRWRQVHQVVLRHCGIQVAGVDARGDEAPEEGVVQRGQPSAQLRHQRLLGPLLLLLLLLQGRWRRRLGRRQGLGLGCRRVCPEPLCCGQGVVRCVELPLGAPPAAATPAGPGCCWSCCWSCWGGHGRRRRGRCWPALGV
jgi:hypothetical protein